MAINSMGDSQWLYSMGDQQLIRCLQSLQSLQVKPKSATARFDQMLRRSVMLPGYQHNATKRLHIVCTCAAKKGSLYALASFDL